MKSPKKPKFLPSKKNFSKWYNTLLFISDLIDKRYDVKGCFVWKPFGYDIMLRIKKIWDELFKENGIEEMYFPLLVPVSYAKRNDTWWEAFNKQAFFIEGKEYILRPTGEPAMYPMFSLWIRSYKDLPLRIYETVSSFRYETKHTRPLIRDREITVWHEIHCALANEKEAEREVRLHIGLYDELWKRLCIAPIKVIKPPWEIFPGAIGAIEYYSYLPNGKVMENGSINNLGQAYAKKFDIKFRDKDGKEKYVWQVCTGNGARLLVAVIATHGDDFGLVLPPEIARWQVVIIPINQKNLEILRKAREIEEKLKEMGIRVIVDDTEKTPGEKFYEYEIKGIPIRIEIGEKEIKEKYLTVFKRNTREKLKIRSIEEIKKILDEITREMQEKARKILEESLVFEEKKENIIKHIKNKKVVKVYYCGSGECWDAVKDLGKNKMSIEIFGMDLNEAKEGNCIVCGKKTKTIGYVGSPV
jgi:prolyl-tRNA synthetase